MNIQAVHLYNFLEYAQIRGCSIPDIIKEMEHIPSCFLDEKAVVSEKDFYKVLGEINDQLADEHLGINVGDFLNLKLLGLIYKISREVITIGEALSYLQSYTNISVPIINMSPIIGDDSFKIVLNISNQKSILNKIILENSLTIIGKELKMMAGDDFQFEITSPYFNHSYPSRWRSGGTFSISFAPFILKAAISDTSSLKLEVLVPEYLKLIEALKEDQTFTNSVKIAVLNMAKPEIPSITSIAGIFNMTPRTLQRRLGSENYTFRQITEELKRQVCLLLLQHNRFSISDISYALGYSEPASFYHSFKKWYGTTPELKRKNLSDNTGFSKFK